MQKFIFVDKVTGEEVKHECKTVKSWFVVSCFMAVLECTLTEGGIIMEERDDLKPVIIEL